MSAAVWFESRISDYHARRLLLSLVGGGYLREDGVTLTTKGEKSGSVMLSLIDQHDPLAHIKLETMEQALDAAERTLAAVERPDVVQGTPDQTMASLLLFGLFLECTAERRAERVEFGRRVGGRTV